MTIRTVQEESFQLLDDNQRETSSPIQEFYKDANVFITGATGFLGKLILQKLLTCTQVKAIYILVRPKKEKDTSTRMDNIFEDQVFDHIRVSSPNFRNKMIAVAGDCCLPDLGIKPDVRRELIENVHIVFHSAATIRFDETLPLAADINVRGTIVMLELATEMKQLKAFVHVSTAYSYFNSHVIKEEFYPPGITGENLLQLVHSLDEETCQKITPNIIKSWPNTYTFTKCIAEDCVRQFGSGLPVVILRPSIVACTRNDPIPGWAGNLFGSTGMILAGKSGLVRVVLIDPTLTLDIVPADMVVNACLALAWHRAHTLNMEQVMIYNYVSGAQNPIRSIEYMERYYKCGNKYPSAKSVWCLNLTMTKSFAWFQIYHFLLHIIPGFFLDHVLMLCGRRPFALDFYRKLYNFATVFSFFVTRSWRFHDDNVQALWQTLTPKDRQIFDFDIASLNWDTYVDESSLGMRKYMLKEDESTIDSAKIRMRRFLILHIGIKYSVIMLGLWLLYKLFMMFLH